MADGYVLVLDAGTSGPRCFVFAGDGTVVGAGAGTWDYAAPEGASPLAREFDTVALWSTIRNLVAAALNDAKISPRRLSAVSVTSQRQAVVFLDGAGREVYAGPNLDLRAVFEGAAIDQELGPRVYATTGHAPSLFFTPAKLRWFQAHRPDAYARIASVLTLADWLVWRLTGELASEPSLAAEAGLLDIRDRRWCQDLLREVGTPLDLRVSLARAGTVAGRVTARASSELGIPRATPVAVSGADTQCGLLGMGVASEGEVGVVAGWSAPLQMITGRPVLSPEARTWAGCALVEGTWVLESSAGDAGNSYRWLADTVFGGGAAAFEEMDCLAAAVPAGADGVVSFLGPSRMDMSSLGLRAGGVVLPVPLTFADIGRGQLARAALESVGYALRANLEQVESLAGARASVIALGGGMTRTRTFARVVADVLGREVQVSPVPQASATGAFLCGAVALGEYGSLEEAASSVRPRLRLVAPDPLDSAGYQDGYERWRTLSSQMRGLSI